MQQQGPASSKEKTWHKVATVFVGMFCLSSLIGAVRSHRHQTHQSASIFASLPTATSFHFELSQVMHVNRILRRTIWRRILRPLLCTSSRMLPRADAIRHIISDSAHPQVQKGVAELQSGFIAQACVAGPSVVHRIILSQSHHRHLSLPI